MKHHTMNCMKILDTTLRDGSYTVDFKFNIIDVQNIVKKSVALGLEYVEIGHGMGLDASGFEHGRALHTDIEYLNAAIQVSEKAKIGFFCIPGIATIESIRKCADKGASFIRIGVAIENIESAFLYIDECRKNNLKVFVNFMKSYANSPCCLAQAAKKVYESGADCVYIVDSAGCMNESDIEKYIDAIRSECQVQIGFHGHNNLGLAVSNTLYCLKQGIEYVDCTYQGIGRSAGNASIEQVIMGMDLQGICHSFDIPKVAEYGYGVLRNIVKSGLTNPLDYICGYAGFHSGYLEHIYKCSVDKMVDPLRLIIAYSKIEKKKMDYELLCNVADNLPKDYEENPYNFCEFFDNIIE